MNDKKASQRAHGENTYTYAEIHRSQLKDKEFWEWHSEHEFASTKYAWHYFIFSRFSFLLMKFLQTAFLLFLFCFLLTLKLFHWVMYANGKNLVTKWSEKMIKTKPNIWLTFSFQTFWVGVCCNRMRLCVIIVYLSAIDFTDTGNQNTVLRPSSIHSKPGI